MDGDMPGGAASKFHGLDGFQWALFKSFFLLLFRNLLSVYLKYGIVSWDQIIPLPEFTNHQIAGLTEKDNS